jgi:hypothetical protein
MMGALEVSSTKLENIKVTNILVFINSNDIIMTFGGSTSVEL